MRIVWCVLGLVFYGHSILAQDIDQVSSKLQKFVGRWSVIREDSATFTFDIATVQNTQCLYSRKTVINKKGELWHEATAYWIYDPKQNSIFVFEMIPAEKKTSMYSGVFNADDELYLVHENLNKNFKTEYQLSVRDGVELQVIFTNYGACGIDKLTQTLRRQ